MAEKILALLVVAVVCFVGGVLFTLRAQVYGLRHSPRLRKRMREELLEPAEQQAVDDEREI